MLSLLCHILQECSHYYYPTGVYTPHLGPHPEETRGLGKTQTWLRAVRPVNTSHPKYYATFRVYLSLLTIQRIFLPLALVLMQHIYGISQLCFRHAFHALYKMSSVAPSTPTAICMKMWGMWVCTRTHRLLLFLPLQLCLNTNRVNKGTNGDCQPVLRCVNKTPCYKISLIWTLFTRDKTVKHTIHVSPNIHLTCLCRVLRERGSSWLFTNRREILIFPLSYEES